jgi:hypothetical protein
MLVMAKSRLLIGLIGLALLAPVAASAQQSAFPPAPNGKPLKLLRERDRHHDRDRHHGRDRDRHDDRWSRNDGRKDWGSRGGDKRDWGIRRDKRYGRDFYRDDTPAGTYSGDWSAWRDSGNGTYTYSNGDGVGGDGIGIIQAPTRNGPKVLGVGPKSFEGACDRSGGVCIIRPGN